MIMVRGRSSGRAVMTYLNSVERNCCLKQIVRAQVRAKAFASGRKLRSSDYKAFPGR